MDGLLKEGRFVARDGRIQPGVRFRTPPSRRRTVNAANECLLTRNRLARNVLLFSVGI